MYYSAIKSRADRILDNLKGWRTDRKILVIESDDWGSIRMPSKEVYEECLKAGYPVNRTEYERYDSILSQDDLELLFNLLSIFRDKNGNHPVVTANCVVTNPDFDRIRRDNFGNYYFELITETFNRYPKHQNNFKIWKEGIKNKILFPQFHAREHLNVSLFMEALKNRDSDALFGFENRMPGCISKNDEIKGNSYIEATRYNSTEDKKYKLDIFLEGLDLFEKLFGYRSETIIPPNYTWSPDYDEAVQAKGVIAFQGTRKMTEPLLNGGNREHIYFLGGKNNFHQVYLVRNAFFEPTSMYKLKIKDPVGRCLSDISIAFRMHKPAIICSHRINYCGFIDESNRNKTLMMLQRLFKTALKKWPDIEFMNSGQLVKVINDGNN
jgi:hypothetical protein